MSVIINGDTGITTPAETVQGALTTTGNTILGDASTDTLNVGNGGLVKDASGNVGIGTASPTKKLQVVSNTSTDGILISGSTNPRLQVIDTTNSVTLEMISGDSVANIRTDTNHDLTFGTNGTERMRIDTSGNLLVGNTSQLHVPGKILGYATGNNVALFVSTDIAGYQCIQFLNRATSGTRYYTQFEVGASHFATGYIYTSDGTSTTYATTSDQRLKENIVDASSGLTKISDVKIRSFDWISTKGKVDFGVIAQELYDVAPECVGVGEDNEDGTINKPWSVDISFLVPALIKSVQELKAIVDAQAVRIAALEA